MPSTPSSSSPPNEKPKNHSGPPTANESDLDPNQILTPQSAHQRTPAHTTSNFAVQSFMLQTPDASPAAEAADGIDATPPEGDGERSDDDGDASYLAATWQERTDYRKADEKYNKSCKPQKGAWRGSFIATSFAFNDSPVGSPFPCAQKEALQQQVTNAYDSSFGAEFRGKPPGAGAGVGESVAAPSAAGGRAPQRAHTIRGCLHLVSASSGAVCLAGRSRRPRPRCHGCSLRGLRRRHSSRPLVNLKTTLKKLRWR